MKRFIVLFVVVVMMMTLGIFSPRVSAAEVPVKFYLNGEGVYTPGDAIEVIFSYDSGKESVDYIKGGLFNSQDLVLAGYPLFEKNLLTIKIPATYVQRIWKIRGNGEYTLLLSVALRDGLAVSFKKTIFISDSTVQFFFTQCCPEKDRAEFAINTYTLSSISKVKEELSKLPGILYDGTVTFFDGTSQIYHGKENGCLSAVYTYFTTTAEGYRVKIRMSQWLAQGKPSQELLDETVHWAIEKYQKGEPLYRFCDEGTTLYGSGQLSMWVWPPTSK
jgi:hypothetical protein